MFRFSTVCVLLALAAPASAADPTYWQDLRPLLRKHCIACHNKRNLAELDISGGLALDTYESVVKNPRKALLTAGNAGKSVLHSVLLEKTDDKRMPLGTPALTAEAIAVFRTWIDTGAKEGTAPTETTTITPAPVTTRKLDVTFATTTTPTAGVFGPGKVAPLKLALQVGPLAPVTAVRFSPDGKFLVAGSYGRVVVWDLAAGSPVKVLTNVLGAVNDLRFSPDGKTLAVAGGQPSAKGDLRLFAVADWKLLASLPGHEDQVASLCFSPDGKRLASGSYDKTVRIWNVESRQTEVTFTGHSDFVYAVAFNPDGKQLASASKDRAVKVIDSATGKSLLTMSDRNDDAMALAWHPTEAVLVASGLEPGLTWWDGKTASKIRSQGGHRIAVYELAFSGDGKLLISAGGDGTLKTWDGTTGTVVLTMQAGSVVYSAGISKDAQRAAAGCFDGQVRVFDVKSGKVLATLAATSTDEWLALTPEGYLTGGAKWVDAGTWRMDAMTVPAGDVLKVLKQPALLAKSLLGETIPAPTFAK